jgi:hypothetical protein
MNNPIDYPEIIGAFSSDHVDSMLQQRENKFLISCHENTVPGFVCNALANLYGDLFSSLPYLEANAKITADTSTYVVRDNDSIVTALFKLSGYTGRWILRPHGMKQELFRRERIFEAVR